jgi:hypothetical protein
MYDPVQAGDYVEFCAGPAGSAMQDVSIRMMHAPSNTLMGEWTFLSVADC